LALHPFMRPVPPQPIDPNDPARQTKLISSTASDDGNSASLYNPRTRSLTVVRKDTQISVGDVQGVVKSIEPHFIQIQRGSDLWELEIGKDLRSMRRVEAGSDDMTSPE
jgi:hypothetical protein